jgi:hypothetical protein
MSSSSPLHYKALLAWRQELERQRKEALADKETPLREALRQRLTGMFGVEHLVELEGRDGDPHDMVLGAKVEGLRFIGFRNRDGDINVVLLEKCSRCGHEMPSNPLTRLADLGRELTRLGMSGVVGEHQCP